MTTARTVIDSNTTPLLCPTPGSVVFLVDTLSSQPEASYTIVGSEDPPLSPISDSSYYTGF